MAQEAMAKVVELLRAVRADVYHRLDGKPEPDEERALVDKAHDLLLLEEGLRRYWGELLGIATGDEHPPVKSGEWEHAGEFTRLVRGGLLTDSQGQEIFVPEAVVRGEGLEHGDMIGARRRGLNERGSPVYYFEVLKRCGGHACQRVSFMAKLQRHGAEWGAFSEEEETFVTVPSQDIDHLKLDEGDLVEVAYMRGDLGTARVAWRFDPDEVFVSPIERRTQPRRERRQQATAADGDGQALPLDGVSVLVVGADAYKESFKRIFERMGAGFVWESGFMVGRFLESKVNRADIVVIVTEAMKHKMPDVEAICERYGRPYVYAPSRGATGAVREVLTRLSQG